MRLATLPVDLLETAIHALDAIPAQRDTAEAEHLALGKAGEQAAFFFLRRLGYTIVARGWKSPRAPGDIDLIGWDDDMLCFVEVKTRSSRDVATAEAAVDEHKRRTLRRLAGYYVRNLPEGTPSRFDVVTIYTDGAKTPASKTSPEIELFRSAFGWFEPQ